MIDRNAPCQERISEQVQMREEEIARLYVGIDSGDESTYERALEELETLPLSIDHKIVVTILLSWGGPSDFIEVTLSPRNEWEHGIPLIVSATYHFQDWFDGASRVISEDSPLWRYIEDTVQGYTEGTLL